MAAPLKTGKQTVDLAAPVVRVSRIRRDPPPKVKELTREQLREREAWMVAVGVIVFGLAIFVITMAVGRYAGWTPRDYTIVVNER